MDMNFVDAEPMRNPSPALDRLAISASQPVVDPLASPIIRVGVCVTIYAMAAMAMVRSVADTDLWWHLRAGQLMVEQGSVMSVDQLSAFGAGKTWRAYSWLFEMFIFKVYETFGLTGILVYRLASALAIVAAIHRLVARRCPQWFVAMGLVAAAALSIMPMMSERPLMQSMLFATLTTEVVLSLREGRRSRMTWLLPLVYIFWANWHIQFVYGLFILGVACAAPVIDRPLGRTTEGPNADVFGAPAWWRLITLTGLCTAATLVNPFHIGIYAVVLEYGAHRVPFLVVTELMALEFRRIEDWIALFLFAWGAMSLGKCVRIRTFEMILLGATAFFAFRARRDVWFLCLGVIVAVTAVIRESATVASQFRFTWRNRWSGMGLVALAIAGTWLIRGLSVDKINAIVGTKYPVAAVQEIERRQSPGPMFNTCDWGGYLEWRLPQLPASIDGRTNLHGDMRIARSELTWAATPGWDHDPELRAANLVIGPAEAALMSVLKLHPDFEMIYEDKVAMVFVRRNPSVHKP